MNPTNQHQAARQARSLLARSLPGSHRGTLPGHLQRAEQIGTRIWCRWQRGPYRWQVKHLFWYLQVQMRELAPGTAYRHWLTLRALVYALGRADDWLPRLRGPWLRPTGRADKLKAGRPPKLPVAAATPVLELATALAPIVEAAPNSDTVSASVDQSRR